MAKNYTVFPKYFVRNNSTYSTIKREFLTELEAIEFASLLQDAEDAAVERFKKEQKEQALEAARTADRTR
jgi:hypothetical protein